MTVKKLQGSKPKMIKKKALITLSSAIALTACGTMNSDNATESVTKAEVVKTYVELAQAKYGDSLTTAQAMDSAIDAFLANPNEATLKNAKEAWLEARVPYQQTEVYRFGNPAVDDWEGKVNAWPLDEGLIDYVDASYGSESDENAFYTANIIANPSLMVGGKKLDAGTIDAALLESLHEIDEVEANVATGYHVVEFLLWGQDLNGTNPGAGARPATDYSLENCTGGNCDRRRDYLKAASELIIKDLKDMNASWAKGGVASANLETIGEDKSLATILTGMGSLAYGELAGERTKLGLMLHDPEEEHDCFADNTHNSHYYDAKGIKNVYLGAYEGANGTSVEGASLSDLVKTVSVELDVKMIAALEATEKAMQVMVDEAEKGNTFDVLIGEGNAKGNAIVQAAVDALVAQTKVTESIIEALNLQDIEIEGSDSLDNPSAVL